MNYVSRYLCVHIGYWVRRCIVSSIVCFTGCEANYNIMHLTMFGEHVSEANYKLQCLLW